MEALNSLLASVSLSNSCDRWFCDLAGDGEFRVKEVRNFIDDLTLPSQSEPTRWVRFIPIKVNIFAWRARLDCLPTRVNLARRGVHVDSSSCPLCNSNEEDVHHLFFCCDFARLILRRICTWWDLGVHDWSSFQEWSAVAPLATSVTQGVYNLVDIGDVPSPLETCPLRPGDVCVQPTPNVVKATPVMQPAMQRVTLLHQRQLVAPPGLPTKIYWENEDEGWVVGSCNTTQYIDEEKRRMLPRAEDIRQYRDYGYLHLIERFLGIIWKVCSHDVCFVLKLKSPTLCEGSNYLF
ncbi:hypothetical protein CTI12_AA183240 [Artemisia annua]|uniref:Reverse transcriptase zinc-binding domain-containing protein n=1 Tax=Artemisia annua TaxID=35608 RepID=A0A2U1P7I2_ARTAN|nr:hypothetical protein CTI12_AA183240 [Artemisia annua]